MAGSTPHLSDLFNQGKKHTVVYPGIDEIAVWVTRPNPGEMEDVQRQARIARARRYHELTDDESPEKIAVELEVNNMDKAKVVDQLLANEKRELDQKAFNEVLFAEEDKDDEGNGLGTTKYGTFWGPEGQQWTDTIDAIIQRMEEIKAHNDELKAAGIEEGHIDDMNDEELTRLNGVQVVFQNEVKSRVDELVENRRQEIGTSTIGQLRKKLIDTRIELECDAAWFTTYKYNQLREAIRFIDQQEKRYFANAGAIRALPQPIQEQLFDAYESLDIGGDNLKNLLTPLPS